MGLVNYLYLASRRDVYSQPPLAQIHNQTDPQPTCDADVQPIGGWCFANQRCLTD